MSGTMVNLDDVIAYIINVATNHQQRSHRTHTGPHGKAQEQSAFVLRRVAEELRALHTPGVVMRAVTPASPIANQTYRNRATG